MYTQISYSLRKYIAEADLGFCQGGWGHSDQTGNCEARDFLGVRGHILPDTFLKLGDQTMLFIDRIYHIHISLKQVTISKLVLIVIAMYTVYTYQLTFYFITEQTLFN